MPSHLSGGSIGRRSSTSQPTTRSPTSCSAAATSGATEVVAVQTVAKPSMPGSNVEIRIARSTSASATLTCSRIPPAASIRPWTSGACRPARSPQSANISLVMPHL